MIKLDGSYGEGGGQLVRTAIALSMLTGKPFSVSKIRAGRDKPGLKPQHLHGIKAAEKLCNAQTEGALLGSQELEFIPGTLKSKNIEVKVGTAGSVTLLLQSFLPSLIFGTKQCKITLHGGTNVAWSMPVEYVENVLLPFLRPLCDAIELKTLKRSYFPKGGGCVELRVKPKVFFSDSFKELQEEIRAADLHLNYVTRGELVSIGGLAHASASLQSRKVAERLASSARSLFRDSHTSLSVRKEYVHSLSDGAGLTLWARFAEKEDIIPAVVLGADILGEEKKSAEDLGRTVALALKERIASVACTDEHVADNLIPFMALCAPSVITVTRVTDHIRTSIYVCEQFLHVKFSVEGTTISVKSC